ncbi:hypothetical protein [Defluviimonas salinarum]|uniref:Uncharacterized protein n=1 Tax=Defluviimonas salinarum TaxID=2992147 RepID=A0ABT3J5R0_9RHOB|nr:hypothetical protein [Defluviimonas salinarum]MCW3783018.1 hypothetical protein [Defluviimonas salinarum]
MTRTREENALDEMHRERLREAADRAVAAEPGLIPDEWMDYVDWLDRTGRDDSFVGDGQSIPGTEDLYDAAMRLVDLRNDAPAASV